MAATASERVIQPRRYTSGIKAAETVFDGEGRNNKEILTASNLTTDAFVSWRCESVT